MTASWDANHPEKLKEYAAKSYQKHKEKRRQQRLKYRQENHEKVSAMSFERRKKNADKIHARQARYYQEKGRDPNSRFSNSRRTAKKKGKEWKLSKEEYLALISEPCHYCGNGIGKKTEVGIGLDRLDSNKGYIPGNVVSCCSVCNWMKGNHLSPEQMKQVALTVLRSKDVGPRWFC